MVITFIDIWIGIGIIFFDRNIRTFSPPVLYFEESTENGLTIRATTTETIIARIAVNIKIPNAFLDEMKSWDLLVEYVALVINYVVYKKCISVWKIDLWHNNTEFLYHLGVIKLLLKRATAFPILNTWHVRSPSLLSAAFSIWSKISHFSTATPLLWKLF